MKVTWGVWYTSSLASIAGGPIHLLTVCGRKTHPPAAFCSTWERMWPTRRWRSLASLKRLPPRSSASATGRANDTFTLRLRYPGFPPQGQGPVAGGPGFPPQGQGPVAGSPGFPPQGQGSVPGGPGFSVVLGANCLSSPPRPRFHLRGDKGNYWKSGLDPQEAALNKVTRIADAAWGQEPAADWGTLHVDVDGAMVTRPIAPIPGDYRLYYAGIRDALLGKAPAPVTAVAAWRVARLLEWAAESSEKRREIPCDWSEEPR